MHMDYYGGNDGKFIFLKKKYKKIFYLEELLLNLML